MHEFEHQLEHYLQGHFHPDVAPQVRREIRLGNVSIEGFLRLADIFQANHEALDSDALAGEVDTVYEPQLFTPEHYSQRFNEVR